jgi:hypothetical protein
MSPTGTTTTASLSVRRAGGNAGGACLRPTGELLPAALRWGAAGWVFTDVPVDWAQSLIVEDAYRTVALKKLLSQLDARHVV